jgi:hypothetical protein
MLESLTEQTDAFLAYHFALLDILSHNFETSDKYVYGVVSFYKTIALP